MLIYQLTFVIALMIAFLFWELITKLTSKMNLDPDEIRDETPVWTMRRSIYRGRYSQTFVINFYADHLGVFVLLYTYKDQKTGESKDALKKVIILKYSEISTINFLRDWNYLWLKYSIYAVLKDGKRRKIVGLTGLKLDEATKAKETVDQNLKS